ncbi:MAG: ribbon-helix-helix protein, CopG family [Tetrasphaera sp.]|jgi:hypothetical protein|nr:ribbon-helix-helix protein, CopG family [Tetrasphaera sp.]
MRTTLSIDDELLERARARARAEGVTVGVVVENALRRDLARPTPPPAPVLPVFTGGTGPRPGIDLSSNRALHEALDEGQPLDRMR